MENAGNFQTIARAIRYIREHQPEQPDLDAVAAHVHLSKYHFQKLFTEWAGVSPKTFLQYLTVERAKEALAAGKSTLHTAYDAGLSGNGRLHDHFITIQACTPGEFKKRGEGLIISYATIATPFGPATVAETGYGLTEMFFNDTVESPLATLRQKFPEATFRPALGPYGQLTARYFKLRDQPVRSIGLDLRGTPFQVQVWRALLTIPSGQALSYGDLATAIGKPNASRAVGTAIGKNPIAYLIPCHRVIRGDGTSGGYRWGPERKVAMNGWERAR